MLYQTRRVCEAQARATVLRHHRIDHTREHSWPYREATFLPISPYEAAAQIMPRKAARRAKLLLVLSVTALAACGGQPVGAVPPPGFINHTQHSDAQLSALWNAAQQTLSQQIDLNPLQRELYNAVPNTLPGDARVWNISPRQLRVQSQADVSSPALQAATGMVRPDPTGLIACPQPCNVQYAPAYSHYARPVTSYAASWESSESNFDTLVRYEFENQILNALGYDTTWR